jgi:hypothetical protein
MNEQRKWIDLAEPFTAHQGHASGLTDEDLRRLCNSGHLVHPRRNVYVGGALYRAAAADPAAAHALAVRVVTTALASRRHIAAGGASAARILGLDFYEQPSPRIDLVTDDPGASAAVRDGYALRIASLSQKDVWRVHDTVVTSPARTLLDLAADLTFVNGVTVAESALRTGLLAKPDMAAYLDRISPRRGVREVRRIMAFADGRTESPLESAGRATWHLGGVRDPLVQVVLPNGRRVDFLWPWYWTVGEGDGLVKYLLGGPAGVRETVDDERERQSDIEAMGFVFFRYTWGELDDSPRLLARLHETFAEGVRRNAGRPLWLPTGG